MTTYTVILVISHYNKLIFKTYDVILYTHRSYHVSQPVCEPKTKIKI